MIRQLFETLVCHSNYVGEPLAEYRHPPWLQWPVKEHKQRVACDILGSSPQKNDGPRLLGRLGGPCGRLFGSVHGVLVRVRQVSFLHGSLHGTLVPRQFGVFAGTVVVRKSVNAAAAKILSHLYLTGL